MAREALPPELVDLAMDRFLAADLVGRAVACEELVAAHPMHAESLRRMLVQVNGAERVLSRSYPAVDETLEIGDYQVVRRLGQGAFGAVFLCEQARPVRRLVAIKVLRPGMGDHHTLRRFAAEQQLLASLSHPTITHVYDAGCLADGRPYFVMEYVDGLSIAEHCRRSDLPCEQRLRLFIEVCRGVEHAHGRGVVHRDLKPANILVVTSGGESKPKIIDFGIAKTLAGALAVPHGEAITGTGHVLGTPGYMSPEQACGSADQVDERADVFALGVVLFELLTGELPWPRDELPRHDATPVLPSARLSTLARVAEPPDATTIRRLAARVRGDLDWIVRKATQADRDDRYPSVREFADDLERHLAGRPVSAGPPTLAYRCKKFLRRHRLAAAALALAFFIGGGGLAYAALRSRSETAAHYADVNRLADNLLRRANDLGVRQAPRSEGVRRALAQDALSFYDAWLHDRPEDPVLRAGRCNALMTLSRVHHALGQQAAALSTAEQATEEAGALRRGDAENPAYRSLLAEASRQRGRALQLARRVPEAAPWLEQAVADLEFCAGVDPASHGLSHASALRELGGNELALGHAEGALAANERSVAVLQSLISRDITTAQARSDLVSAQAALAMAQSAVGRHADADASLATAAAGLPDVLVDRARATAVVYAQQGRTAALRGDDEGAIAKFAQAVAASEAWQQQEPGQLQCFSVLLESQGGLAACHERRAEWPEADRALGQIVELRRQMIASFPQRTGHAADLEATLYDSARTLWYRYRRQDLAQARTWVLELLALQQQHLVAAPATRPLPFESLSLLASLGDADGQATGPIWQQVADQLTQSSPPAAAAAQPMVLEAWLGVARCRLGAGDLDGARAAMQQARQRLDAASIGDDFRAQAAVMAARVEIAAGDVEAASQHVRRVLELRPTWWGHWQAGDCEREAAAVLQASGTPAPVLAERRAHAAEHYRAVVAALADQVAATPEDPWLVVPWGLASLGLAEMLADGDAPAALAVLESALPRLAGVEAAAHRDAWDERRVAAGRALRQRLAGVAPR